MHNQRIGCKEEWQIPDQLLSLMAKNKKINRLGFFPAETDLCCQEISVPLYGSRISMRRKVGVMRALMEKWIAVEHKEYYHKHKSKATVR
jgi:hypothetical protein